MENSETIDLVRLAVEVIDKLLAMSTGLGSLARKDRTSRREKEPISYWIGMAIGTFAFLVLVSATAVMAFLVCVGSSGTSK